MNSDDEKALRGELREVQRLRGLEPNEVGRSYAEVRNTALEKEVRRMRKELEEAQEGRSVTRKRQGSSHPERLCIHDVLRDCCEVCTPRVDREDVVSEMVNLILQQQQDNEKHAQALESQQPHSPPRPDVIDLTVDIAVPPSGAGVPSATLTDGFVMTQEHFDRL
eukprot:TRINITY_DN17536_c0_g1_i1.p1 TRINITY_DN17536_c0_g1~~TRINITY_DN17536_c0_g1_i1.p1  ORF type:complete len:165 (+),score=39.07 TRINITY_DN17536_c0_g1_i1:98-592(+)